MGEVTIFQMIGMIDWGTFAAVGLQVVGAFALIATKTPNKSDDKIVQFFLDLFNFMGANAGKAANKPE